MDSRLRGNDNRLSYYREIDRRTPILSHAIALGFALKSIVVGTDNDTMKKRKVCVCGYSDGYTDARPGIDRTCYR